MISDNVVKAVEEQIRMFKIVASEEQIYKVEKTLSLRIEEDKALVEIAEALPITHYASPITHHLRREHLK